ncbi:LamG domain-containing protein [Clostridium botulinum]|nr:LamG domain-containing protein [Clostridium botulinum]
MEKYIPKKDYSLNLIAKYKFEETTGTTCIDSTGKYNGTYYGTTSIIGENGNARSFNGTKEYISTNLIIPKKNSIKLKIKTSVNNNNVLYIFNSDNSGTGFDLYLQNGTLTRALYCDNYKPYKSIKFNKIISDNNWHTCLITNNRTLVKFYIDDLINTEYTLDSLFWTGNTASTFWGCHRNTLGNYFNGQLDEIEIYDEVIEFTDNKYLIQDKNNILYILNENNLVHAPLQTLDENNFNSNGFSDISKITKDLLLSKFENLEGIKLLVYTDDLEKKECEMIYNCEPFRPIDNLKKNGYICNILFREV